MAISVIALWVAVTFVTVSQRGLVSAHGGWQKPTGQVHPNTHTKFCYALACTFIPVVLSGGYVLYLAAGCSICSIGLANLEDDQGNLFGGPRRLYVPDQLSRTYSL